MIKFSVTSCNNFYGYMASPCGDLNPPYMATCQIRPLSIELGFIFKIKFQSIYKGL